ncbi:MULTISPECIES: TetR-like C-terminal domain-containing protein [Streptomyces]|uniref:TetR-like C-terminal domain-containing protein n=1 Tax=Streptomyces TaxID=1883 RepID=UPI0007C7041C|nr:MULTISPECIES: TetR-like C-terminal domain-containing protein [unclassified Streptomyces]AVH98773.1 TetR family transcriptional regulator [Streptomyces sp. WAC00288]
MTEKPVQRRPGGRTARNRENVLRAAADLLLSEGYEQLTIARVAAAAQVAETTVYRRWRSKTHLAADALSELVRVENPVPDTGTLEGDLRALLTQVVALVERPEVRRVILAVVSLAADDAEVVRAKNAFWEERFTGSATLVRRAVERGELPADTDPDELIEDLAAPVYFRLLVTGRSLDSAFVERSVELALSRQGTGPASTTGRRRPASADG